MSVVRFLLFLLLCLCVLPLVGVAQTYSIAWDRTFGTANYDDWATGVFPTSDGGILVTGYNDTYMYALKLDSAGNKKWDRFYKGIRGGSACFSATESINKDGYVLAGQIQNALPGNDLSQPLRGFNDAWILKIDANGNKVWDKRYGGTGNDQANSIIATPNGYLVVGITNSPVGGDVTIPPRSGQSMIDYDVWTLLLDGNGNLKRQARWGGDKEEHTDGAKVASIFNSNDRFAILAYTSSNLSGDFTENSYGGYDYWLVISDTLLNLVTQKRYGGGRNDYGFSLINKGQDT